MGTLLFFKYTLVHGNWQVKGIRLNIKVNKKSAVSKNGSVLFIFPLKVE